MEHNEHITRLFRKYLDGTYTERELDELLHYFNLEAEPDQLANLISQELDKPVMADDQIQRLADRIGAKLRKQTKPTPTSLWMPIIKVAAIITLALSIAIVMKLTILRDQHAPQLISEHGNDIQPGGNHAVLTLADGSSILLDSVSVGFLAEQSGMSITKSEDGIITYTMQSEEGMSAAGAAASNTITVPRGGQYKVVLPDGTHVWLNAASSLTYPIRFVGNERRVKLEGEAYFDVAHNARKPFIVNSRGQDIQVLGTQFNVNAYADELSTTTTLVTGKVEVFNTVTQYSVTLAPGQQATLDNNRLHVKDVDTELFTAWKNGLIVLHQAGLPTVVRQIERWYNVTFEFEDGIPSNVNLNGKVPRNIPLTGILNAMEISTGMKFTIGEERRVMVHK